MTSYEDIAEKLRQEVLSVMDYSADISDDLLYKSIDSVIMHNNICTQLTIIEKKKLRKEIFDSLRRLDVLQDLIEDEEVTEIMVNGPFSIFYEKNGKIKKYDRHFSNKEKLEDVARQIVSKVNRTVNTYSPIADARLADGSRVNVVLPPAAPDGPIVTIRRFPGEPIGFEKLIEYETITKEATEFLKTCVIQGKNIFVSGGTGSGKTTFLNALSYFIPEDERIITIEDSLELRLAGDNLVRLEARNANPDCGEEITIRDLIKTALRMRPDRLIVGEIRGEEALDMLQAMNTGHEGSLSTGHANSPKGMLSRIETMVLMSGEFPLNAIRAQIASAIDIIVHLERGEDGSRKVMEIDEVCDYVNDEIKLKKIFCRREGKLVRLKKE